MYDLLGEEFYLFLFPFVETKSGVMVDCRLTGQLNNSTPGA